jgi:L-2-hydroxyglutarate oxidase LhgO
MSDAAVDVLIVGAGVTGLAAALEIARAGHSTCIVEQHHTPGMETSGHNSGVIHAGLYYPPGTLKARMCVEGAERMYAFCTEHDVPHERCGKFVVASTEEEVGELETLRALGAGNGAPGLEIVSPDDVIRREPFVRCTAALWSPNSGRVEAETLVRVLLRLSQEAGAIFLRRARVLGGDRRSDGPIDVRLDRETIEARVVVNAAGLYADDVSKAMGGESFHIYPCRGEYAELKPSRRDWIRGLVYPLPHASGHGLGTHLTRTTRGSVLLGPTIRYQDRKDDYEDDRLPLESFVAPAQILVPGIQFEDLTYGGSGIRPKLHPPTERFADFLIRADANVPSLVHAAGIDSPGLTSCLANAILVRSLVEEALKTL